MPVSHSVYHKRDTAVGFSSAVTTRALSVACTRDAERYFGKKTKSTSTYQQFCGASL